ncbi:MAG: GNAT family N-acetyltransferase [Tepidiformaceae bacterium]
MDIETSAGGPAVVRRALPDDATAIEEVTNEAYVVEAFFKVDARRTDEAEIRAKLESDAFLVVDGSGERLRGSVYVAVRESRGYLGMLSVAPGSQRGGLGRALITAAEEYVRGHGCTAMDLTVVNLREELPAWYEKAGYRVCGAEPWPETEQAELTRPAHLITMTRELALSLEQDGARSEAK